MTQPYPNPNITGIVGLVDYANNVAQGWITPLFLIVGMVSIFIIMKTKQYRTSDSFAIAAFIPFMLSTFLWIMGLLPGQYVTIFLALFVISMIFSLLDRR